jgi:hypothetical protein
MSGATLIAIAIVVFVLLVSAAVVKDWPIAGLVGGGDEASVSSARPASAATDLAAAPAIGDGAKAAAGRDGAAASKDGGGAAGKPDSGNPSGQGSAGIEQDPGNGGGSEETAAGGGGGGEGSAPTQSPGGPSGGSGGTATSGGSGGGSGGGGGGGGTTTSSPSTQVAGTVNETVEQVDQTVTGGALEETGVTQVTEGAVNGVAGPESVVGKTVDEAAGTVEGVLGGNR